MDERRIEENLKVIKEEIPVNRALKATLRKEFMTRRKTSWFKRAALSAAALAAVACLVAVSLFMTPEKVIEKASAASLKIANHFSFVEIGGGSPLGVSEHDGKVFVPVAGKGIFKYDQKGFLQIIENKEINSVRVSPDGTHLAYTALGTIFVVDLSNNKTKELLKGSQDTYFEEPVWAGDGKRLVYTKKTVEPQQPHGFSEKNEIYQVNLETMKQQKLCEGAHASFVTGTDTLIFERDQKIIQRNMKNGTEKIMDNGRFPAVSPDGEYVAYVKTEEKTRTVGPKAQVMEQMDNVWIADAVDFKTKKRVTSNFPHIYTDEKEWVKSLKPLDIPQILTFSGKYSYYEPVWSSDSNSLYLLKNINQESGAGMKLARIDFTDQKQGPEDTVKKFLQALVVRDEDFAKSIMKNPPDVLTTSNPHNVGFTITGKGKEGEKEYVTAEVKTAATATPYYVSSKAKFYLSASPNGYIIDEFRPLSGVTVYAEDGTGQVYLEENGRKEVLFRDKDIPKPLSAEGKHRFASMAYDVNTKTLVFTLQLLQDGDQKASVRIISYNLTSKQFKLIDHVTEVSGNKNVGVSDLIVDDNGEHVALNLFSDDSSAYFSNCYVYNLKNGKQTILTRSFAKTPIDSLGALYWDEDQLIFSLNSTGQNMKYMYNPTRETITSF